MGHKILGTTLTGVAAAMILGAPAFADQDRVSATEKGSLVIFSKIEIRWSGQAPNDLIQDTFLQLSNDNENPVKVQIYVVNGDAPLDADPVTGERAHPGWNAFNGTENLTANQPICWSAADGGPFAPFTSLDPGDPPGRPAMDGTDDRVLRGFAYAWAIDADGDEIEHDHLFGNGLLVNYADSTAWEYNTYAHQVNNGAIVQDGVLNLDGNEYSPAFNRLVFNFVAWDSDYYSQGVAGAQVVADLDITLHPVSVDLRQEGDGPITTKADIFVWNENENEFSEMHRCITCWDQTLGSLYTADALGVPNFFGPAIGTDCGYARVDGVESNLCDIDVDLTDGPIGAHPNDVESVDAALLGVAARLLEINGMNGTRAASGYNMVGTGTQAAVVQYDRTGGSEPAGENWEVPATSDIQSWLEDKAGITTRRVNKRK